MERYECHLSDELLEKAVKELNEPKDNDIRLAEIDKLRTRFQEDDNGMDLIRTDDAFILRFLRVRKFYQDRAYQCLCNYHKQRQEWPEVFDKVNQPSSLAHFLEYGPLLSLGQVANDDTFVIIGRPGLGFDQTIGMIDFVAVVLLTLEHLLEDETFQINGITVIQDLGYFFASYSIQMISTGPRFLHLLQDAMPIRVKSMNMVKESGVFDLIWAVVSKFMKQKMKDRLQVHGNVFTELHKKIPADKLPSDYGGTKTDVSPDSLKKKLMSCLGGGEDTAL